MYRPSTLAHPWDVGPCNDLLGLSQLPGRVESGLPHLWPTYPMCLPWGMNDVLGEFTRRAINGVKHKLPRSHISSWQWVPSSQEYRAEGPTYMENPSSSWQPHLGKAIKGERGKGKGGSLGEGTFWGVKHKNSEKKIELGEKGILLEFEGRTSVI